MENKLSVIIENRKVQIPKFFISKTMRTLLFIKSISMKAKYYYHFDKKEMKKRQVIILSDHASRHTFYYTLYGYKFVNPNVVMGYHNIFQKYLFKILLKSGVILKSLYETDVKAIKEMFDVVKKGGSLCLFPEGIQSTSGSTHPMNPSTIKFIKKLGIDVVLANSFGSYLSRPRFTKETKKGRIEIHYSILFTKEELQEKSVDELYNKFIDRFKYNDFTWNEKQKNSYIGKHPNHHGITNILYRCPKCGSEFTLEETPNSFKCSKCQNEIVVDKYYNLVPVNNSIIPFRNIDEWYKDQRKRIKEEIKNPNFMVSYDVYSLDLYRDKIRNNQYYIDGEGQITINHDGIYFNGKKKGEDVQLFFEIISTPSFGFTAGIENDLYYHGQYYCFRPKSNNLKVVKYMLYVEELHNLIDDNWKKVSEDVYD